MLKSGPNEAVLEGGQPRCIESVPEAADVSGGCWDIKGLFAQYLGMLLVVGGGEELIQVENTDKGAPEEGSTPANIRGWKMQKTAVASLCSLELGRLTWWWLDYAWVSPLLCGHRGMFTLRKH